MNTEHYFDWAATTPPDIPLLNEALAYSTEHWGNPSSIHEAGADAKRALEDTRKRCAAAL
jgi:cysteine desulfurase